MLDIKTIRKAHLIGIGGIHVSAVAKLLLHHGVKVTGSELSLSEITRELAEQGAIVRLGQDVKHVPLDVDGVIYSSAVPPTNVERLEADRRDIPSYNSHAFLGLWYGDYDQIVIAGTHGKSTTTAMVGLCLVEAGRDPSIIVGTKVSRLEQGNIRFGTSKLVVLEGDEYDRHFLSYSPKYLLINNLELDHIDQYPDMEAIYQVFGELIQRVQRGGMMVANGDEANVRTLLKREEGIIRERNIAVHLFGASEECDYRLIDRSVGDGQQIFRIMSPDGTYQIYQLQIPGSINTLNATGCIALCDALRVSSNVLASALTKFPGVWRRSEKIADKNGIVVLSDYGHHPTAVARTIEAVKEFYPARRLVLCFQPHHRNRTRHLFLEFVSSFDLADELLLVEIYDVAGREEAEDETISSQDLCDAIRHHDADRGIHRSVAYAADSVSALKTLKEWIKPGDVVVVMGAGDIYQITSQLFT